MQEMQQTRTSLYLGAGIFLLALLMRTFYLAYWVQSPYFGVPLLDEQYHHDWAMRLATGLGNEAKPFFRAPLYPHFLSLIYMLADKTSPESVALSPRIVQALLGAFSALLTYSLARMLFGSIIGTASGILAAIYPAMIFFDGELLLPPLLVFLNLLFAHALIRAFDGDRFRWWLIAGVTGGLSAITRPNILLPMMALGLFALWRYRHDRRHAAICVALYALGALVIILPVTIRNRVAGGDWVLIASQGGINLYAGNGPGADGFTPHQSQIYSRLDGYQDSMEQYARIEAERALGKALRPSEVSSFWTQRTIDYVQEHPGQTLKLLVRKAVGWWTRVEVRNNKTLEFALQFAPPILALERWVNFAWIGPLALVGIFLAWRRQPQARPLIVLVLVYQASFLPFFVCDRYRVPMLPFLFIFAMLTAHATWMMIADRRWKHLAMLGAGLIATAILVNVDWYDLDPQPIAEDYFMLSICYESKGETENAKEALLSAVRENPQHFSALHNLGRFALQAGNVSEALEYFQSSIDALPRFATAYNSLGTTLMLMGRKAEAVAAFEQCLSLDPQHTLARKNLDRIRSGDQG